MAQDVVRINLTYAKNALFVRQTVAVAFGIPLDQEFTWPILYKVVSTSEKLAETRKILIEGMPATTISGELKLLSGFFREINVIRPDIEIAVTICN